MRATAKLKAVADGNSINANRIDLSEKREAEHTQGSLARLFAQRHRGRLMYESQQRRWYECSLKSGLWKAGDNGTARKLIFELCEGLHLKQFERSNQIHGIEDIACTLDDFAVSADSFDQDAFVIGTPDGPVDLRSGSQMPADSKLRITMSTSVAPSSIEIPRWEAFLRECTGDDAELIRFLKRFAGYALTGDVREHCMLFIYGPGRNGKGVFFRTIAGILGSYAHQAEIATFTDGVDRHPTDFAAMRGKRLVVANETEKGRRWAESRIKEITGGDRIRARFMRQDGFEYSPSLKLVIVGNHEPALAGCDEAMRGRFRVVPFDQIFAGTQVDRTLDEKLRDEWPGILRWMIDGCTDWQRNGLAVPSKVESATARYFERQDTFGQWLNDCTERGPQFEDTSTNLWAGWKAFAEANGDTAGSQKTLAERLLRLGAIGPLPTRRDGKSVRIWRGLKVSSQ